MSERRQQVTPTIVLATAGAVLLATAVQHHFDEIVALNGSVGPLSAVLLDGLPAVAIVVASYWLLGTDLRTTDRWRVCKWAFAGMALFVGVIGATLLIRHAEGRPIAEPLFPLLVAAEMGALGGFVSGYYNVRMREQARKAQRANARLEEVNNQLESSNERLEQFAYAASHDLQEPLRMVSSYLQLLEDRYADELDEDAEEFIEFAVDGAERMTAMIDSLLEYSRVGRGDPLEPTDANEVLNDVLTDLQLQIEETGATVTADDLPTVVADADQLGQVFQNLISNALTYSGDEPPRVHIGVERDGDAWRFSVADNGIGIDPENQGEIFDMFQQLGQDTDSGGTGAGGIGLAMCDRIVERHDGDIWVKSEPGEGSIFYFTMPAPDEQQKASSGRRQAPPA